MYHSFFIHSSVNGHPFSTDNKDKEWRYVLVKSARISLAFISQIKIAGLKGEIPLTLLDITCQIAV